MKKIIMAIALASAAAAAYAQSPADRHQHPPIAPSAPVIDDRDESMKVFDTAQYEFVGSTIRVCRVLTQSGPKAAVAVQKTVCDHYRTPRPPGSPKGRPDRGAPPDDHAGPGGTPPPPPKK